MYYLIESSTTQKRYKCPYCQLRDTRDNLISHIEKEHEEMIPQGYTPTRVIFNMINKKSYGTCMICKKETRWDEDKERYDTFCSDKCKQEYVKIIKARMINTYGKESLLNDPNHQIKMLHGRKIAGQYRFTSGGILPYVGSYEKMFLEFIDVFLHIKIKDIISDYPVINYMWNNESHFYIPDYYYIPYNLVIDIKDGGSNPNTRQMDDYRDKQLAKEKSIIDKKEYNYLRLTDNDFSQLISIFMELKELAISESQEKIVRIHESVGMNPLIGINIERQEYKNPNTVYLVAANNGLETKLGISRDKTMFSTIFTDESNHLSFKSNDYLDGYLYKIFKYTDKDVDYKYNKLLEQVGSTDYYTTDKEIYKYFTNKDLLDFNQIFFDEDLQESISLDEELQMMESSIVADLLDLDISIPVLESTSESINIEYAQDLDGYYVYNKDTDVRSKSYEKINDIPEKVLNYISTEGLL